MQKLSPHRGLRCPDSGLVAGYFWATADTSDPAASFPKWAYVTGVWFVGFVIVHLWYILKPKPSQ